jgi:hypothetical protein
MVLAQGLGDEEASRDEKGNCGAGASVGPGHAPLWLDSTEFRWSREVGSGLRICVDSRAIGGNRGPTGWNEVPRGTMNEVNSFLRSQPAMTLTASSPERWFHLVLESHVWNGLAAESEEKREPVYDVDTGGGNGLKALDPHATGPSPRASRASRHRPRAAAPAKPCGGRSARSVSPPRPSIAYRRKCRRSRICD